MAGGGGGVGQGAWPNGTVTGEGAGKAGRAEGEGGLWVRGEGVATRGRRGRGPAARPGGLLIITGGEGGSGVKLDADHTADLG